MNTQGYHVALPGLGAEFNLLPADKEEASQVLIDGHQYRLVSSGQSEGCMNKIVPGLENSEFKTFENFEERLKDLDRQMEIVPLTDGKLDIVPLKTHSLGTELLLNKPGTRHIGEWCKEENKNLPLERKAVAQAFWQTVKDPRPFLDFLKGENIAAPIIEAFTEALKEKTALAIASSMDSKNHSNIPGEINEAEAPESGREEIATKTEESSKAFISLFDHFSRGQVDTIEAIERLNIFPMREGVKDVVITDKEMARLGDYMQNVGFSGVVSISVPSDGHALHTIGTDNINNTQAPFSIHSVGKIFTGLLATLMIKQGIIDETKLGLPVQLDDSTKEAIREKSPILADHLEKTSLRELMLHQSGLKDYLGNYQDAIEHALEAGSPVPEINRPEDLIQFAEVTTEAVDSQKGEMHYSNLGLLLVGLSIQHLYNEKNKGKEGFQPLSYDQILEENIFRPAGMTVSLKKPAHGVFNDKKDPVAPHICATPSGGHWTTAQEMQKFGKWIYDEVKKEGKGEKGDQTLFQVMERHGGEFYRDGVVSHLGAIESASAQFSTSLDNGVIVTVMSNREKMDQEFAARQIYYTIDRNILTREITQQME